MPRRTARWSAPSRRRGHRPDVLWSCTNCGACVEQCPVDIEHVDHILDMRRYQVLIESSFPSEAGVMLRNLENRGNPWGMGGNVREDWIKDLDFEVTVADGRSTTTSSTCSGSAAPAPSTTAPRRSPRRSPSCCTSPASSSPSSATRRPAPATDPPHRTSSSSSDWPWRTSRRSTASSRAESRHAEDRRHLPALLQLLGREYPQVGGEYEVVHHTQLLGKLIEEGRLTPVTPVDRKVTYHDPCFLGRHNKVYTPPREILDSVQGLSTQEMHRCKDRGFCCGAGGAHVDGGEDRQAHQHRAHRGGPRARPRRHLHRVPVLHHDAERRTDRQEAGGQGRRARRGPRRQPDPAALDDAGRRQRPGRRSRSEVGTTADDVAGTGSAATEHGQT